MKYVYLAFFFEFDHLLNLNLFFRFISFIYFFFWNTYKASFRSSHSPAVQITPVHNIFKKHLLWSPFVAKDAEPGLHVDKHYAYMMPTTSLDCAFNLPILYQYLYNTSLREANTMLSLY